MSEAMTVAILGNVKHAFDSGAFTGGPHGYPREFDVPYEQLPKVVVEVDDDETLGAILGGAAAEVGIRPPHWSDATVEELLGFVDFHRVGQRPEPRDRLVLVDAEGRARWRVPFKEATTRDLIRASESGTLAGDPRRPYLFLLGPQAAGGPASWSALIEALSIAREVLEIAAAAEGARALGKLALDAARKRLGAGRDVVHDHYLDWDARGARPDSFAGLLRWGPWHNEDLAERLGCSPNEAEAILWTYGYVPDSVGLWRRGDEEAATFLREATADVQTALRANPDRGFERAYRRRVEARLNGEALPNPRLPEEREGY
jgi:hypothetical protein